MASKTFLTTYELAAQLGVHPETIRRAIHRGQIPSVRIGNRYFIAAATVAELGRPKPKSSTTATVSATTTATATTTEVGQ